MLYYIKHEWPFWAEDTGLYANVEEMMLEYQVKVKHIPNNTIYAIASILSPIIAGIGMHVYQSMVNSAFWRSLNSLEGGNNTAGAIMASAEAIQIIVALTIGCLVGIILAVRSIYINKAKSKIGITALILNGLLLLLFSFLVVKSIIFGI